MSDEHADHEKCENCGGCVPCGCLCHLAGDPQETGEPPLTLESMGLLPFMDGEGLRCPKCRAAGTQINYHEMIILTVSDDKFPCQEWVEKNLLGGTIGEHLCVRCQRCRYGFPMRTAG